MTAAEQFAAQETAVRQKGTVVRQLRLNKQLAPAELQPVLVKAAPAMYRMPHSHATSQQIKAWQQQLLAYGNALPDEASHAKQPDPLQHLVAQAEMQSELIGAFPGSDYRPVGPALRGQPTPQIKFGAAAQNYSDAQTPALLQKTSLSKQLGSAPQPAVPSRLSSLNSADDLGCGPHRGQQMPGTKSMGAAQQQYDAPRRAGLQQGSLSKQLDSAHWLTVNDQLQPALPGSAPLPTDTIAALGSAPLQLVKEGQASDFGGTNVYEVPKVLQKVMSVTFPWGDNDKVAQQGGGSGAYYIQEQHRVADDRHLSNFLKTRELTAYASQLL